jgi:transposase-like protein
MSKYTFEDKIRALLTYLNGHDGGNKITERLGISRGHFWNWVNQYKNHGENAFKKGYTNHSAQYKLDILHFMQENVTSIHEKRQPKKTKTIRRFFRCLKS